MVDKLVPGSDEWWLDRLLRKLDDRMTGIHDERFNARVADRRSDDYSREDWLDLLWAHYKGDAPFLKLTDQYAAATKEFMRMTRSDFPNLIVSTLQDRTQVVGGATARDNDDDGDEQVRQVLADNGAFFSDALRFSYVFGRGGVLVGSPAEGETSAVATPVDPREAAWETDPLAPQRCIAFLRKLRDPMDGITRAYLYLPASKETGKPDRCRRARLSPGSKLRWDEPDSYNPELPVQGLGVPFTQFVNDLEQGEFERHLDLIERVQNGIADRMWASKFQVFFMRAFIGEFPEYDQNGNKIDWDSILMLDPGAAMKLPTDVSVFEGKQLDLNGFAIMNREDLKELSAVSRTPLPVLSSDNVNQSAEGANQSEKPLIFKANDRVRRFRPAADRVLRLALAHSRETPDGELIGLGAPKVRSIWAPTERHTLGEQAQMVAQTKGTIPTETIMSRYLQMLPDELAAAKVAARKDTFGAVVAASVKPKAVTADGG